jgi:hypothetical protein
MPHTTPTHAAPALAPRGAATQDARRCARNRHPASAKLTPAEKVLVRWWGARHGFEACGAEREELHDGWLKVKSWCHGAYTCAEHIIDDPDTAELFFFAAGLAMQRAILEEGV